MRLSEGIKPISYVKANTGKVLEQVKASGPIVITQNGEASAVLMCVKDYERLTEGVALLKILSMSEKSLQDGKGIPAEEAFVRLRARIKEAKANG